MLSLSGGLRGTGGVLLRCGANAPRIVPPNLGSVVSDVWVDRMRSLTKPALSLWEPLKRRGLLSGRYVANESRIVPPNQGSVSNNLRYAASVESPRGQSGAEKVMKRGAPATQ